jgi:hypothetical protein
LDNWRWYDTIFRLRTGKALGRNKMNRMEVAVHFRPVPHLPRGMHGDPQPKVLRFGLEPESIIVELTGVGPRANTVAPDAAALNAGNSKMTRRGRAHGACHKTYSRSPLSISNTVGLGVAGCLGNGSMARRGGSLHGTALDSRDPTRLEAGKCSVRTASGLGLRCGRYRNGRILRSAIAVGWHGGTSSMGRSVGCGWIRRYLDRSIHVSPVEVPI